VASPDIIDTSSASYTPVLSQQPKLCGWYFCFPWVAGSALPETAGTSNKPIEVNTEQEHY